MHRTVDPSVRRIAQQAATIEHRVPDKTFNIDRGAVGHAGPIIHSRKHAARTNPSLRIILASKGLIGKSGCTRMVQGGYNAVLDPADSLDKHLTDTLTGGQFINQQELAYTLVRNAPTMIHELDITQPPGSTGCPDE